MPLAAINGIRLNYEVSGSGEPVVMVMGTGSGRRVWQLHQVPALTAAGYQVITFDNRGIPPSDECADGFAVADLVGDLAGLIEHLGLGACRVVGTSLGAQVAQELALARPGLVTQAVLIATRGRTDAIRAALARAENALNDAGVTLPAEYRAVVQTLQMLSPATLRDDRKMADWLDLLELSPPPGPGVRAQYRLDPMSNRLPAYQDIRVPCHVIAFADDLVTPPEHGREVADAIPHATFDLIPGCGHYGYLEDPATVN
ncbi:alpha/beta fold hydrolase, partial [Micromonospora sp. NPDC051296]|uniref:alpha/beta fold hydrolase n=1 Tax=Micromonospora sp. NPDC051296 TaxID=3155046 RepID=UPI0034197B37